MNNFVEIRLFKTFQKVSYYTFWVEGREKSETDTFFAKFENDKSLARDLDVLVTWLVEIGNRRGAKARYFRQENAAEALPPPHRIMTELSVNQCNLRLYCIRLSEEIVILANGGLKTSQTVQDSPDIWPKFNFANKMAQQILKHLQAREIDMKGSTILNLGEIELWD